MFVFWLRGFYSETLLRLRNFQISSIIQSIGDALGTHCRRGGENLAGGMAVSDADLLFPYIVLVSAGGFVRYTHDDQVVFQRRIEVEFAEVGP